MFSFVLNIFRERMSKGILFVLFASMLSSSYPVFGKYLLNNLEPYTLVAIASFVSAVVLFFVFGVIPEIKKLMRLIRSHLFYLILVSLLAAVIAPLLLFHGLKTTSAVNATLLASLEPVLTGIIAALWLKESVTSKQVFGAISMVFGVYIIITHGFELKFSFSGSGDILIISSSFVWAFASTLFKKYLHALSADLVVLTRNAIGAIVLFIVLPFFIDMSGQVEAILNHETFFVICTFSVLVILFGQFFWYRGLELIPASNASSIFLSEPFFGVLAAMIFLGENVYHYHLYGGFFVIVGLVITVMHHQANKNHIRHQKIRRLTY